MKYEIKSWISVDADEPQFYSSLEAARKDLQEIENMQPENHYEIHAVEEDSEVECYFCGKREKISITQDTWIPSFWHNEFQKECGPVCKACADRLEVDMLKDFYLPAGG